VRLKKIILSPPYGGSAMRRVYQILSINQGGETLRRIMAARLLKTGAGKFLPQNYIFKYRHL
jgi:hypothetical protein